MHDPFLTAQRTDESTGGAGSERPRIRVPIGNGVDTTYGTYRATPQVTNQETAEHGQVPEYAELKRLIRDAGLLDPRPANSLVTILANLALLALGLVPLVFFHQVWFWLLDAAFLAIVFAQISFVAHDAGHGQICRGGWRRDLVRLLHGNLLLGVSAAWWIRKHNQHHSRPNQDGRDPDIDIPVFAFSDAQARKIHGLARLSAGYQAYLLFPLLLLEAISLREESVRFLLHNAVRYRGTEVLLFCLHFAWYGGVLVALLGVWQAVLFIVVHQALFGLYMGSVFAPNHKGMLMLPKETELDFLSQQVLTARNIRGHRLIDWWYGGLNYQIEHHLFPTMPRENLKFARPIVRAFCATHSLTYHETSMLQSYREIVQSLHEIGRPLRETRR